MDPVYKIVKVVCGNQSDNHCKCNQSDTLPSTAATSTPNLVTTVEYRALLLY